MIGVFDSGYGGLTVLRALVEKLPGYDYVYLGDNARAPYGTRSFETVYEYTLESVKWLFAQGCPLVILACNTASAKALRSIQQKDLGHIDPSKRVLGVIRPTTEVIGNYSTTGEIGILATPGTVSSGSYPIEIAKFFPEIKVFQQACPMWVPLIENNEHQTTGADYFVRKCVDALLEKSGQIDTILLACTHYPLLQEKIAAAAGPGIRIVSQGEIVADSLADYLQRHPEIEQKLGKNESRTFYTTDSSEEFDKQATTFYGSRVESQHVRL
ncbi:MAG TPA: glutamate racemase [Chitinophagaceae bacterium]|nr:glutamate racemase [Chitinophagaceae bacterium]